jgi:type IX secretion system PorP/SprF family membrane protein
MNCKYPYANNIRILFILCIVLCGWNQNSKAQQVSQYTQYLLNYYGINPAAGGTTKCLDIKVGYRRQWWGFQSAPTDQFFSMCGTITNKNKPYKKNKHVIGFYEEQDKTGITGPTSRTSFYLNYSYHQPLANNWYASVGFFAGLMQYSFRRDEVVLTNQSDAAVGASTKVIVWPDINPGILLYHPNFFIGYSMKYALQNKLTNVYGIDSKLQRHNFITMGAKIGGNRSEISFLPSVNLKMTKGSQMGLDVGLLLDYNDAFRIGVVYRKTDAVGALVQFRLKKLLIGYAYDYTTSKIRFASANSHEIMLSYRICKDNGGGPSENGRCYAYD